MNCCPECFGDRSLRTAIVRDKSAEIGKCDFCESDDVSIVTPANLLDPFDFLLGAYAVAAEGISLVQCLREDWGLFDNPRMDDPRAKDLLAEIFDDGEFVRKRFVRLYEADLDPISGWEELRDELMYHNRFFPKSNLDLDRLEILILGLARNSDADLSKWYRARVQTADSPFQIDQMGAPPRGFESFGRANPVGIPCLYLGSTAQTAITEIRPHTGQIVCVADFDIAGNLSLVDLRNPRKMLSPFGLESAEEIGRMRIEIPFLVRLGEELTRPVVPHGAAINYTPTQYLCEFIKWKGYQGVLYLSSVSEGINLALFDPALASGGSVSQLEVTGVVVETAPV
jgi:hypothetical protein